MDAVAVDEAGSCAVEVAMPDLVGFFRQGNAARLGGGVGGVEQAELDLRGVFREQRKIYARAIPGRAEGCGLAGPDRVVVDHLSGRERGAGSQGVEWGHTSTPNLRLRSGRVTRCSKGLGFLKTRSAFFLSTRSSVDRAPVSILMVYR